MHEGHPCPDLSSEYFKDGIVNGAKWYTVAGESRGLCNLVHVFVCLCVLACLSSATAFYPLN